MEGGDDERVEKEFAKLKMDEENEEKKLVMVKDILERSVKSRMEIGHLFVDILNRLDALEGGKRKREE